jgi:hypothetical protein
VSETIMIHDPLEEAQKRMEEQRALALLPETAVQLHRDVQQMGEMMARMGQLMAGMQRRMDEMEARQEKITVRHADVKRIQQLIRIRTAEICGKYALNAESAKVLRAAIKKDVLKRWGVKDLHDLPAAAKDAVENAIGGWTNIRLVMERRGQA